MFGFYIFVQDDAGMRYT